MIFLAYLRWGNEMAKDKIKILHMTPPDINNGVYRYIFNHMIYMDMQKYQFGFLTRGADKLKLTKEHQKYAFQIHALCNTQRENRGGLKKEIVNVLNYGYDIIHLHTSSWRGFLIEQTAMEMGIQRVIVHSHSTGIDAVDGVERERQMEEHEKYKSQFSMKYATDVWSCSTLAAEWLFGKSIPQKKIQILRNAIDVKKYRFNPEKRQEIRAFLNLENRIVIGNVGRYSYQKNQKFLIKAFAQAHAKTPSLFLLCLGEGELLEYLRSLVNKFGIEDNTLFMEWQENVEDYLQGMDLFCLPSRFEGLPISVIEAQTAGVKCLISDNVTKEVKITDLVKFLPLSETEWVEELAGCRIDVDRHRQDENIAKAGYDIQRAAKRLEALYRI